VQTRTAPTNSITGDSPPVDDPADDEALRDDGPSWVLLPSSVGLGTWLACRNADASVKVLAPPGVPIDENWDDERLLGWRVAYWPSNRSFEYNAPAQSTRSLDDLAQALELVPNDALGDRSAHRWMIVATESHADALERLVLIQEVEPGREVQQAVAALRQVVRRHREQSAHCSSGFSASVSDKQSAHEVAQVLVDQPTSVPALIERDLKREPHLRTFASAVRELEREHGRDSVQEALTGLLFAKQHSSSWRFSGYVREAKRSTRRVARAARRLVEQLEHSPASEWSGLPWSLRSDSSSSKAPAGSSH
jgi:hypothetical protein